MALLGQPFDARRFRNEAHALRSDYGVCRTGSGCIHDRDLEATDDMERCCELGDLLANVEADFRFHHTIIVSSTNRMLRSVYETVQSLLTEIQRQPTPRTNPPRMRAPLSEHCQIIEALAPRDAFAACSEIQRQIENTAACAGIILNDFIRLLSHEGIKI